MIPTADRVLDALKPYDLRKVSPTEYEANSPFRAGSNSHAFKVHIDDGEHGAFFDHVTGEKGSLYQLATQLKLETPKQSSVSDTKRKYDGLADYAKAHFVDADAFSKAGWRETTHLNRPALAFKTASGERFRFIDGEQPEYINPKGYQSCLYGLAKAPQMALDAHSPLIICNGEASTVVAQFYGIPAVCQTGGEKKWKAELVKQLNEAWKGEVIIALDCDDTGRRVATEIADQFTGRATVVDLGLGNHGDLADFCGLWNSGALGELTKRAASTAKPARQSAADQLVASIDLLRAALRDKSKSDADVEHLVTQAQSLIDQVSMGLAKPTVVEFSALTAQIEQDATERREQGGSPVIGLRLNASGDFETNTHSGFPQLEAKIGGLPDDLTITLGATGSGKSWTLISLARELLPQMNGLIVTTEMEPLWWLKRLIASASGASYTGLKHGTNTADEWARIQKALKDYGMMSAAMLDHPSPTPRMIRAAVQQQMETDAGIGWVMVDSASKMNYPGSHAIYDRMSGVMNGLQDISREFSIPVIASLQTSGDIETRGRGNRLPRMNDAYGGMVAVQNAGVVISLYNHAYYAKRDLEDMNPDMPEGTVLVRLLKIRDEDDSDAPAFRLKWTGAGYREWRTVSVDLNGRKDHDA